MLYLWMPEGQGTWLWRVDQEEWQVAQNIESLIKSVQLTTSSKEAVVFFPSQTAQFDTKTLPRAQYKQLGTQGIQYLLEENSIEPIDYMVIFHHYAKDELHMMAMSKSIRETYQHSLSLLPWQISALLPDFLIVQEPAEQALNIIKVADRTLWRWGSHCGWQCDDLNLIELWANNADQIRVADLSDRQLADLNHVIADADKIQLLTSADLSSDLSKLKNHPFNALLKVKKASQQSNYWKACAALFVAALSVQVLYDGLRWWKYKNIADQTAELALNQYKQWFPNETRVNEQNLVTQFTAKIRANSGADTQVLQLISRIGPILQQASIVAQQVQYQDNSLSLQLIARNSEQLQKLTEEFKQQGFTAELGVIQNKGNDVIGMIKVQ